VFYMYRPSVHLCSYIPYFFIPSYFLSIHFNSQKIVECLRGLNNTEFYHLCSSSSIMLAIKFRGTRQAYVSNVTLCRVRVTIVAVENSKYYIFWVGVYSFCYQPCNSHALYYIYGQPGCTFFFLFIS
jgi:hypothetical protein